MSNTEAAGSVTIMSSDVSVDQHDKTVRERWLLGALVGFTALAYVWDLPINGWANPYYAAAVQAAAQDWRSFVFGSLDWGNTITVDKPPLALWPMALSVKLFGLNSWSLLFPQALLAGGTVAILFAALRRVFPSNIAFTGAIICGTTPVFFLMSRYDNPEPMMGFLTAAGLYAAVRAASQGSWRWYLLCGASFGFAFLAKQLQGLIPVPALAIAILLLGVGKVRTRIIRLLGALAALVVSAGWWVTAVELTPVAKRPYIGGSQSNDVLELALGYNGLGRVAQTEGSVAASQQGEPSYDGGLGRLFSADFAPEIGWLLPTALISVLVLVVLGKSLLSRHQRMLSLAAAIWLVSTWLLLSFMASAGHPYYTYSLVVPEAVAISAALRVMWLKTKTTGGRLFGVVILLSTAYIGARLMQYSDGWSWWDPLGLVGISLLASARWFFFGGRGRENVTWAMVIAALVSGQIATDVITASQPIYGTQPMSGPVSRDPNSLSQLVMSIKQHQQPNWAEDITNGVAPSAKMRQILMSGDDSRGKWIAATFPAQDAALVQLTTGRPTIAIGGWVGRDPAPTLEQFKALVAANQVQFFIDHPSMDDFGLGLQTSAITRWVRANYSGQALDNAVIYRLGAAHRD